MTTRRRARGLVLALALALLVGGCDVRVDGPPPPVPEPGAAEQVRQGAAEQAARLADLAAGARDDNDQVATDLADVAADAVLHVEALGGVWQPPPRPGEDTPTEDRTVEDPSADSTGTGSGTEDPTADDPAMDPEDPTTAEEVLDELRALAADGAGDLGSEAIDGDLATLLLSIAVHRSLQADLLAAHLGRDVPPAEPTDLPDAFGAAAGTLCRTLDAAGYAWEVAAARRGGDPRAVAAARAERLRSEAEEVAVRAGLDGTAQDPREAVYALDSDPSAAAERLEAELLPLWVAQVSDATPQDRRRLLDLATAAAARSVTVVADATGSLGVATFPGLG